MTFYGNSNEFMWIKETYGYKIVPFNIKEKTTYELHNDKTSEDIKFYNDIFDFQLNLYQLDGEAKELAEALIEIGILKPIQQFEEELSGLNKDLYHFMKLSIPARYNVCLSSSIPFVSETVRSKFNNDFWIFGFKDEKSWMFLAFDDNELCYKCYEELLFGNFPNLKIINDEREKAIPINEQNRYSNHFALYEGCLVAERITEEILKKMRNRSLFYYENDCFYEIENFGFCLPNCVHGEKSK